MARQIDPNKPLSDDDRAWLENNNQFDRISIIDAAHGTQASKAPTQTMAQRDLDRLASYLYEQHDVADSEDPVDATIRLLSDVGSEGDGDDDQEALFEDGGAGDSPSAEDDAPDYASWTNDDLRAELGRRELSKSGTKDEMVDRLEEADDED